MMSDGHATKAKGNKEEQKTSFHFAVWINASVQDNTLCLDAVSGNYSHNYSIMESLQYPVGCGVVQQRDQPQCSYSRTIFDHFTRTLHQTPTVSINYKGRFISKFLDE